MKVTSRGSFIRLAGIIVLLCSAVATLVGTGAEPAAQAAGQTSSNVIPFNPITLADLGPISTNITGVMWYDMSGDYVGYAYGQEGCGHCGQFITRLNVVSVLNLKRVEIKAATTPVGHDSGGVLGALNIHFEGAKLVWDQPNQAPPPGTVGTFSPGDYACAHCYYDAATGQGGEYNNTATPVPTAQPDWEASVIAGQSNQGGIQDPDTIKVVRRSTGQVVINQQLPQYQHAEAPKVGSDKLVYVQYEFGPEGEYASPSLVQVVWLLQPDPAFANVWAKADGPVAQGKAARSWLWGPAPDAIAREAYEQGPGGTHLVQYYDKSRMEVNNPNANPANSYYVTNGLLVTEMVSGQIQIGDAETITASVVCTIPVAGDPRKDNPLTPGYSTLAGVASLHGNNQVADRTGQPVSESMDVNGKVANDTSHRALAKYVSYAAQTGHNIPDVFMNYLGTMNSTYGFDWTFVVGYPITEAYWTKMRVSGQDHDVLIQAFQRRVLTYTPDFPKGWQVQQGNVGQHYYEWRYFLNKFKPFDQPF